MKKRLNIKLLAGLVFGSVFFCIVVYFLHEFQVRRNADALLVRADAARQEGNLREAIRIRRRYLAHRPEDVKQYKQLAIDSKELIFNAVRDGERIHGKELGQALDLMEQAVFQNGKDVDLRREAADFWFQLRQFDDAVDHLKYIQGSGAATLEDEMRYIECLRQLGGPNETQAVALLNVMVGYDAETRRYSVEKAAHPESLQAYRILAAILHGRRERDQAEAVVNQMVAANPDDYQAYLSRAALMPSIRRDDGQQRAKADIQRAAELAPEEIDVLIARANLLKNEGQFDDARTLVRLGLSKESNQRTLGQLYRLLAEIAIGEQDIDRAFQVLDEGLAKLRRDPDLLWTKAQLRVDRKEFEELPAMLDQLRAARVPDPMIAYLESRVLIHNQRYNDASKMLAKIRPLVDPQTQYKIDVYLSQCYTMLGQTDAQLATLERILDVTPELMSAQLGYAENLIKLGRHEEALRRLTALEAQLHKNGEPIPPQLATLIVDIKMRKMEALPEDKRDWSELEKIVTNLYQRDDMESLNKLVLVIQLLVKEGNIERAISYTERAIKDHPENFALRALRLDLAPEEADARNVLAKMEQDFPGRAELRISRAKLAIKYDPQQAPEVIRRQEQGAEVFEPPMRAELYRDLATLQLTLQNPKEATRLLELAHQSAPTRLDILTTLYEMASADTDPDKLREIVNRIESITTRDDTTWKMAEAGRIVWMVRNGLFQASELVQARSLIEQIRQHRPEWVPVLLLEADIHRLSNDTNSAIRALEAANRFQPNNTNIVRRLAQLYNDMGNIAKAQEMMEKLPYSQRSDHDNRNRLKLLIMQGDFPAAMELADVVLPESTENALDLIWRSQIFLNGDKLDVAERAARAARRLEPGLPDVWTNLVNILARQDKKSEAAAVLQDADLNVPEQLKPMVLGQCYALLGDANRARNQYLHALRNDPNNVLVKRLLCELLLTNNQIEAGRELLNDILKNADPRQHGREIQWARRALATVLASTRRYTDFQQALETIELNAVDGELPREDLALLVTLSTQRPESESWRGAISRLEQIEKKRGLTDDEKFMKAQLYERYDELWPQVREIVHDLLTRNAGNTVIVERWVQWLLKRGDLSQAERWKRSLPQSSLTRVRVETHALAARGNHRQALRMLEALIPPRLDGLQAYAQLVTVAQIAEELGQYDKSYYEFAEAQLRDLAQKEPKQILRLASVMGLHGDVARIQQALQMCMEVKQHDISLSDGASISLHILRAHPEIWESGLKSSIDTLQRWLDQELLANPQDFALKARVAEFHDMMGHLDRVEREYREILAHAERMNPRDRGMILNNLAYIMALNGKTQEPLELLQQAIDLLGPTTDLIDTRGYIRLARGETAEAVKDFQLAISSGTKTGHKLFHLALALDENGDSQEAADSWKEALDRGLNEYKLPHALRDDFRQLQTKFGPQTARRAS